jgi:excisionase family DNA binding protein
VIPKAAMLFLNTESACRLSIAPYIPVLKEWKIFIKKCDYNPDVVDLKQLGETLRVRTKTACRLLQENKIEHFRIGRIYKIPKIHVLKYLKVKGYLTEKGRFSVVNH